MPLPQEVKRWYIKNQLGLDPEKFDLDDNTYEPVAKEAAALQPALTPTPQAKSYSATGTAARNFGLGILPTAGGLAAGAGTTAAALALAPEPFATKIGALGLGALALGAGIVGSIGTAKVQEKVLESTESGKEFLANTAQANVEHPLAATVGNIASALPTMRFNPKMLVDAGKALSAGQGVRTLANPAVQQLAIGAGIGAGQGIYDEMALPSPEGFSIPRFALNVAGNALMSPRDIRPLRALGVRPYESPESYNRPELLSDELKLAQETPAAPTEVEQPFRPQPPIPRAKISNVRSDPLKQFERSDAMARYKTSEPRGAIETLEGEGGIIPRDVEEIASIEREQNRAMLQAQYEARLKAQAEAQHLKEANDIKEAELKALEDEIKLRQVAAPTPKGVNPQREFTKGMPKVEGAESAEDLRLRQIEEGLAGRERPKYQAEGQEEVVTQPEQKFIKPSQQLLEANKRLAVRRGVELEVADTPTVTSPGSGEEVAGYVQGTRGAIGTKRADTGVHELAHVEWSRLPEKLRNRFLRSIANDEKAQAWMKRNNVDGEEYLVQAAGDDDIRRILSKDNSVWRDLTAWFRANFSRNAKKEDVVRFLTNRVLYSEPVTKGSPGVIGIKTKEQTASEGGGGGGGGVDGLKADRERYSEIDRIIAEMRKTRSAYDILNDPDVQALMREQQVIKNRYGGHKPSDVKEQGEGQEPSNEFREESKRISFKDQLEGNIEERVRKGMELWKQSDLKVGDKLYSERGTEFTIYEPGISVGKDGRARVFVKSVDKNGDESRGTAFLDMLKLREQKPNQEPIFPRGIPPYVGHEVGAPRDSAGGKPAKYFNPESSVKTKEAYKLVKSFPPEEVERYQDLYSRQDELDMLEQTELETLHNKYKDAADLNTPIVKQISKEPYPASGETIPEVARQQRNEQEPVEIDTSKKSFFSGLEASFNRVEKISKPLATAFKRWEARRDQYLGLRNVAIDKLKNENPEDIRNTFLYMRAKYRGENPTTPVDERIRKVLSEYFTAIRDAQIAAGLKIQGRAAGKNPDYVPDMLSDKAIDLFTRRAGTIDAKAAVKEWAKYVNKESEGRISIEEATRNIKEYIDALGATRDNYRAINFGALRKAQGYGLPQLLREENPMIALNKYSKRAAADLALYQELESKPEIASVLKLRDPNTGVIPEGGDTDIGANVEVRKAMKWVMNNFEGVYHPAVASFVRLVNNSLLGIGTGIRDIVAVPVNSLPYINRFSDLSAYYRGMTNIRENAAASLKTHARQHQQDKLMWSELLSEAPNAFLEGVNKLATGMRKWQGRELIEQASRIWTFGVGKELARNNVILAKGGNAKAKAWLDKFGLLVDEDVTKLSGDKLNDALNTIAKNFTDRVQGTYGGRGLPTFTQEGALAPFVTLQKWGIEKSNVIYKDVIAPAISGENYVPLLSYTLGSVLTGAAIQELNKILTNRKPQEATIKETLAKPDIDNVVAELITLMQLGSWGGIVSDGAKAITDVALRGKTPRNVISFPAATAVGDTAEQFADVSEALQQGEEAWPVLRDAIIDFLVAHVQNARMIANHTVKREDIERSDKFRDYRVYRELSGEAVPDLREASPNKYLNRDARTFKRATTVEEVREVLPKLAAKLQELGADDPAKARKFLRGLKANSYQTMPSPETRPEEFAEYYKYLVDTLGETKAEERVMDYMQQNEFNRSKTALLGAE